METQETLQYFYDYDMSDVDSLDIEPLFFIMFNEDDGLTSTPILKVGNDGGFLTFDERCSNLKLKDILAIVRSTSIDNIPNNNVVGVEIYQDALQTSYYHYIAYILNRLMYIEEFYKFMSDEDVQDYNSKTFDYITSIISTGYTICETLFETRNKDEYIKTISFVVNQLLSTLGGDYAIEGIDTNIYIEQYQVWLGDMDVVKDSDSQLEMLLEDVKV